MASPFPEMTSGLTPRTIRVTNGGPLLSGPRFRSLDPARSGLHCFRISILVSSPLTDARRRIRSTLRRAILARAFMRNLPDSGAPESLTVRQPYPCDRHARGAAVHLATPETP